MAQDQRYDRTTKTQWLFRRYDDPDTLVPEDEVRQWSKALRDGQGADGQSLSKVNYIFADEDTAEYNHHALAFARLGTYVGSLDRHRRYGEDETPSFDTKDDFGI